MEKGPVRILLVRPHSHLLVADRLKLFLHLEPLELEIVAGGVPEEDQVSICDLSHKKNALKIFQQQLADKRPHILGLSGYSTQSGIVRELATIAKRHNPDVIVVVGGIHATIVPADYAVADIDIIVRGEGGTAFKEILRRYKNGEPLHFGEIALSPLDPDFSVKAGNTPPRHPRPEEIPRPRRNLVDRSLYFSAWSHSPGRFLKNMFPRIATIRTSYGCAYSCNFCVVPFIMRREYLQRTPEDVVDEIEQIKEEHIYFVDDETFLNAKRMTEVANLLLKKGIKKKYVSWARSDTIVSHPELFALWKKVGLSIVYVGLEAMVKSQLDEYNKGIKVETNRKAVEILKGLGITLHASFMVNPDFTEDDFRNLEQEMLKVCPAEVSFTVYSPSPGTAAWDEHKDEFILDPYLYYDCFHSILPIKNMEINKFYAWFGRLYTTGWRQNPLKINWTLVPLHHFIKAIINGTKYIIAIRMIFKDYLPRKHS